MQSIFLLIYWSRLSGIYMKWLINIICFMKYCKYLKHLLLLLWVRGHKNKYYLVFFSAVHMTLKMQYI